jgi:hypothetical protein
MDQLPDALVIHVDALLEREQARDVVRRLDAVPRGAEVVIEFAPSAGPTTTPTSRIRPEDRRAARV